MNDKAAEDYQQAVKLTTDEARRSELLEKLSLISPETSMDTFRVLLSNSRSCQDRVFHCRRTTRKVRSRPKPPGLVGTP